MNGLIQIEVVDILEQDLVWLMAALKDNPDGYTPQHIITLAVTGLAQIWRVAPPEQGILVTKLLSVPRGTKLEIWWMAGEGLIKRRHEIYADLIAFAKSKKCFVLSGNVLHKGLCSLYKRAFKAKLVSWVYYSEVV